MRGGGRRDARFVVVEEGDAPIRTAAATSQIPMQMGDSGVGRYSSNSHSLTIRAKRSVVLMRPLVSVFDAWTYGAPWRPREGATQTNAYVSERFVKRCNRTARSGASAGSLRHLCGVLLLMAVAAACSQPKRILSPYGTWSSVRRGPTGEWLRRSRPHSGVDVRPDKVGGDVIASAAGVVTSVVFVPASGYSVTIGHPTLKFWTRYVHLQTVIVGVGNGVRQGEKIGTVGLFQRSSGIPHVHWMLCTNRNCAGTQGTRDPIELSAGCISQGRMAQGQLVLPVRC